MEGGEGDDALRADRLGPVEDRLELAGPGGDGAEHRFVHPGQVHGDDEGVDAAVQAGGNLAFFGQGRNGGGGHRVGKDVGVEVDDLRHKKSEVNKILPAFQIIYFPVGIIAREVCRLRNCFMYSLFWVAMLPFADLKIQC